MEWAKMECTRMECTGMECTGMERTGINAGIEHTEMESDGMEHGEWEKNLQALHAIIIINLMNINFSYDVIFTTL